MRRAASWLLGVALALGGGSAWAQEPEEKPYAVELNAGLGGFTGAVGSDTSAGPTYGVRASFRSTPLLSWELGFQGHTNAIAGTDENLSSNMLFGGVKAGPEIGGDRPWRPYAAAGLGVNFVFAGSDALGLNDATQTVIPLSIGADFFTDSTFRVGARATYDLVPGIGGAVSASDPHPDQWQLAVGAQAAF